MFVPGFQLTPFRADPLNFKADIWIHHIFVILENKILKTSQEMAEIWTKIVFFLVIFWIVFQFKQHFVISFTVYAAS